jgi:KDO2-lipid IV(A) lauroyltransferase
MSARRNVFRSAAEYLGFYGLVSLLSWLPARMAIAAGRAAGRLAYGVDRRDRRVTLDNLQLALGLSGREARTLARRVYSHLGETLAESLHLWTHLNRANLGQYVEIEGIERVKEALAAGRGVVFVTGHIGNWELGGLVTSYLCGGIVSIAQPARNPWVDAFMMRFRTRAGQRIVPRKGGIREMVRALREGKSVAILMDQDARRHGIIVPFFGLPASTIPTAARLALSSGAPIVAAYVRRIGPLRYRARYLPPIYVRQEGDRQAAVRACTENLNGILEEAVRQDPVQWLWPHQRWKTGLRLQGGPARPASG